MLSPIIRREKETPLATAQDGAKVREFFGEKDGCAEVSLAGGYLPPGRKAIPHTHEVSDEFYVVVGGKGLIHLNDKAYPIDKGDQIFIPRGVVHALENNGHVPLKILCVSIPPFKGSDYYPEGYDPPDPESVLE